MIVMTTLGADGAVGHGLGRASDVALAKVDGGEITSWSEVHVGWDELHDEGTEGSHHARIATFLKEHDVDAVVAQHAGPGMQRMLGTMGIRLLLGAQGDARRAVLDAARSGTD